MEKNFYPYDQHYYILSHHTFSAHKTPFSGSIFINIKAPKASNKKSKSPTTFFYLMFFCLANFPINTRNSFSAFMILKILFISSLKMTNVTKEQLPSLMNQQVCVTKHLDFLFFKLVLDNWALLSFMTVDILLVKAFLILVFFLSCCHKTLIKQFFILKVFLIYLWFCSYKLLKTRFFNWLSVSLTLAFFVNLLSDYYDSLR